MKDADIDNLNLQEIKKQHLEIKDRIKYKWLRQIELIGYLFFSMLIHIVMLIAGKSLLIAESIKDKITKKSAA